MKPLAIDLFCGLGGWTEGLLAEGYHVIGFDNEQHVYGEARYPAQLVIQDVLTLHGSQFADADLIVASPPCQAYSYRAMPWKRAKALPPPDNSLFEACFRLQREAIEAAGRHIPLVVENVCGAQKWVGRARWHFGSFYLWGDVPALMPIVKPHVKVHVQWQWSDYGKPGYKAQAFNGTAEQRLREGGKIPTGTAVRSEKGRSAALGNYDQLRQGLKGADGGWFNDNKRAGKGPTGRLSQSGSKSPARKAASAMIAKIPITLSRHIAAAWKPQIEAVI